MRAGGDLVVRRGVFATVLLCLAALAVSCGDGDDTGATIGSSLPPASHTMPAVPTAAGSWRPAEALPADLEGDLSRALAGAGDWMLFPTEVPFESDTSAELSSSAPAGNPTAVGYHLVVRPAGTGGVLFSLSGGPADVDPCETLFPNYPPVQVRGAAGCALAVDGVDFLNWVERGRWFHAEWDDLPLQDVLSWLGTWKRIP